MAKKIFIWVAHPISGSLSEALAEAYRVGASAAGADVHQMNLHEMSFDLEIAGFRHTDAPLEPDLLAWQSAVAWADHLFIVHPYWWGAMPAKAKGVLDRALAPGFGFKYHSNSPWWDKLLAGKTADTIITSDTPSLYDWLVYRKPGRRVLRNQVLGFCGIKTRKSLQMGPVKLAKPEKIARWLAKAERLGASAAR